MRFLRNNAWDRGEERERGMERGTQKKNIDSHLFFKVMIISFFFLSSFAYLTYFMMFVEKNIILTMREKEDKWHISTKMGRFDGLYSLISWVIDL